MPKPLPCVSTGRLPETGLVLRLLDEAHQLFQPCNEGRNADHIPALALVPREIYPNLSGRGLGAMLRGGRHGGLLHHPPLDAAGNALKGQLTARFLSDQLGLNMFAAEPASPADPS